MAPEPIDLRHGGAERVIGVYLLDTEDGPALFDCGPSSCIPALERGLAERGCALRDIRHLLLSHIHLDHAGAAGVLVRQHPELQVHVSPVGAPHLVDPSRLEKSARRLYGDAFDRLWGELAPVPRANVHEVTGEILGFDSFPSPGHAAHHVVYTRDGVAYCGDAAGVRIQPHAFVMPPTPPPEVDVEAWEGTIEELRRRDVQHLALIHFGVADDVQRHLDDLDRRLHEWASRVQSGADEEAFVEAARTELEAEDAHAAGVYEPAMPLWQSYAGLARWAERQT